MFYSFLSYGIAVWAALTHKSNLDPVIVRQKKIVRILCFEEPAAHTEPLFKQLQFLKVRDTHELELLHLLKIVKTRYSKNPRNRNHFFRNLRLIFSKNGTLVQETSQPHPLRVYNN